MEKVLPWMSTILKYQLLSPDHPTSNVVYIDAPRDFHPLSVHVQYDRLAVWGATVDAPSTAPPAIAAPKLARHAFLIAPTGVEVDLRYARFLGTVLLQKGTLVFHVFHLQRGR